MLKKGTDSVDADVLKNGERSGQTSVPFSQVRRFVGRAFMPAAEFSARLDPLESQPAGSIAGPTGQSEFPATISVDNF